MRDRRQGMKSEPLESRRLLAHVGLDLNFGDVGRAEANGEVLVASLPGGKVLVVSATRATRLNADGTEDTSFFDEGGAQATFGKMRWIAGDAVISGDRLYLAGMLRSRQTSPAIYSNTVFVRALNLADGSKVDSFGDHGFTTTLIGSLTPGKSVYSVTTPAIAATDDGGVVFAVGQRTFRAGSGEGGALSAYRMDARGRFDFSFAGDGELVLRNDRFAEPLDLEIDSRDRIVILHVGDNISTGVITRLLADGTPDADFGEAGSLPASAQVTFPRYVGFTLAPDDGMLLPVMGDGDFSTTGYLTRVNSDGSYAPSATFRDRTRRNEVRTPSIDAQGRIVVPVEDFLVRLSSDLQLDPTFDNDGVAALPTGFKSGNIDFDASGAILVGNGEGVSRYLLDTAPVTLGPDGVIRVEGDDADDRVTARLDGRFLNVFFNEQVFTFRAAGVAAIQVTARDGDNVVDLSVDRPATVSTSWGNDEIYVAGPATVMTGAGVDNVHTGDGDDTIFAGGTATIFSGGGDDTIGSQEPEVLPLNPRPGGSAVYLEVTAGEGDDVINPGNARSTVWAGAGNDLIDNSGNSDAYTTHHLNGESGDDTIRGGAGVDVITGGTGNNVIDGGNGMNRLDGSTVLGPNFQTDFSGFTFDAATGLLTFAGTPGPDDAHVIIEQSVLPDGLIISSKLIILRNGVATAADESVIRAIRMIGADGNDDLGLSESTYFPATIDGGNGDDEINGGRSADLLLGGDGSDSITGYSGDDTINAGTGNDSLYGHAGNDVLRGEDGDDYFEGGKGNDRLFGDAGADRLFGLAGNDVLFSSGDATRDTVRGGDDMDTADADEFDDVLSVESFA